MNSKFSELVQTYFINYFVDYAENTRSTYKYGMITFIKFLKYLKIDIDTLLIKDLTLDIIKKYIKWLKEDKKLKNNTINLKVSILKSFMEYTKHKTFESYNISRQTKNLHTNLKHENNTDSYLSDEEIKILLNSIDINSTYGLKHLAILSLLYECGLRVQELCNLKKEDLEFKDKKLYVMINKTKGNKSRKVPTNYNTSVIVKRYISEYNVENQDYLFMNQRKDKYTRKGINYILKKYYEICRETTDDNTLFIKPPHVHMLRHSRAVSLLNNGVPLEAIQQFLGHESLSTTQIYAIYNIKSLEKVITKNSKSLDIKHKYTKKKKAYLENWLKNKV